MSRILEYHLFDRFNRRDRALVLQWNEGITPFTWEEVVQAAQVLSQLDVYGPILLEGAERTFRAPKVA